jgi:hypothetical protein
MMEVVAFGGTLAWLDDELPSSSTWMLAFGGPKCQIWPMTSLIGGLGFDGDDGLMEEDTPRGLLAHVGMMYGLWRPNVPQFQLDVTLWSSMSP